MKEGKFEILSPNEKKESLFEKNGTKKRWWGLFCIRCWYFEVNCRGKKRKRKNFASFTLRNFFWVGSSVFRFLLIKNRLCYPSSFKLLQNSVYFKPSHENIYPLRFINFSSLYEEKNGRRKNKQLNKYTVEKPFGTPSAPAHTSAIPKLLIFYPLLYSLVTFCYFDEIM